MNNDNKIIYTLLSLFPRPVVVMGVFIARVAPKALIGFGLLFISVVITESTADYNAEPTGIWFGVLFVIMMCVYSAILVGLYFIARELFIALLDYYRELDQSLPKREDKA